MPMDLEQTQLQGQEAKLKSQQLSCRRTYPPTQVPGYDILNCLGQGAYGEVWVASERNTGRQVAIKFYVHRGGLDWSLLSREVEKLAFLFSDRYVVQLIDVGWDADPPYYIMEYIEQGSLEDRLHDGPLSVEDAVAMFRDIAVGLVHSHGKGVLHCDLKPANILLDQDSRPRLCDFGQSRLSHEQTPALGTLFYMAPEQADLQAVPHARWDVYALGALLYCMLTGSPPHRTEENIERINAAPDLEARLKIYREILAKSPKPNDHRKLAGVDRGLADIIDRCLSVDPHHRYPNVQVALDALNLRERRRARRPLLVMGTVAPALLLMVVGIFAYRGFQTAVGDSRDALRKRALESNRFAAWYVSETVARGIDQRWQNLALEAQSGRMRSGRGQAENASPNLGELLAERVDLEIPAEQETIPLEGLEPYQRWLEAAAGRHMNLQATSWFVTDVHGFQLARVPPDEKTIGHNWAYRDYFNGKGRDADAHTRPEPIREPHLSIVFTSGATGFRMVAFSVPVWSGTPGDSHVVGVLAMTVELGKFAEIQRNTGGMQQVTSLVDSNPDGKGRRGSLLEHPYLAEVKEQKERGSFQGDMPEYFLTPEQTELLTSLTASSGHAGNNVVSTLDRYHDPVGGERYGGEWIAAIEPVVVDRQMTGDFHTGWAVVVQEPSDAALEPVANLRDRLLAQGGIAISLVLGVVAALWGLVLWLMGTSSRWPWARSLRRHVGLATQTPSSGTAGRTPTSAATKPAVARAAGPHAAGPRETTAIDPQRTESSE